MSSTFLSSYLREVTSSLSNWHEDNYDFYRFGPQPEEQTATFLENTYQGLSARQRLCACMGVV